MTQHLSPQRGSRRLTRRSVLGLVAGLCATGLVAACGGRGGNQGTTASTQVPLATTPQAPAAKQTLTGTATPAGSPSPSPAATSPR